MQVEDKDVHRTATQNKFLKFTLLPSTSLPVDTLWKMTGIGSLVTKTSSSFSELDT
uniref:Uncharacterized protein n=1 Tax=Anguilla anguilla TaxID=7936 RepID=A0A0E9WK68_ANGAN